jgi:subtilisin family serine protease
MTINCSRATEFKSSSDPCSGRSGTPTSEQLTAMASPHAAGVAALIVSQFRRLGTDAGEPDVVMRPQEVESYLEPTTIRPRSSVDNSLNGYDPCFGNGRVDAMKAVLHDTSSEIFAEVESTEDSPFGCPTFE